MHGRKIVVACFNANGDPDFAFVVVRATDDQCEHGEHYAAACRWAENNGYEGPMVAYGEYDPPKFLFDHFVWESASLIGCHY